MFNLFKKSQPAKYQWVTPPLSILSGIDNHQTTVNEYTGEALANFITAVGIPCKHVKSTMGASVVQHHFNLVDIRHTSKVKGVIPMISAAINCEVTQAKGDNANFSLILPRLHRQTVHLKNAMLSRHFAAMPSFTPSACLGSDSAGNSLCVDIVRLPHLLIAGATGSGKSVLLNSIITSILFKATPSDVKFVMVDLKFVELTPYQGLPHLMCPVITDANEAIRTLNALCDTMDTRYHDLQRRGLKSIAGTEYPHIVVILDEFAELMALSKKQVENAITRLCQKGRAAGISVIFCTQRPQVSVVTGIVKANIPARIALTCASNRDSMTVLDHKGAESLVGRGDALLKLPDRVGGIRFQSAYTSAADIQATVDYWKTDGKRRVTA